MDPGEATGIVLLDNDGSLATTRIVWSAQADFETVSKLVLSSSLFDDVDAFVMEQYIITQRTTKLSRQPTALHVIGLVKARAIVDNVVFKTQTSADAKTIWPNRKLKDAGLLLAGGRESRHMHDATRHGMLFLQKARLLYDT